MLITHGPIRIQAVGSQQPGCREGLPPCVTASRAGFWCCRGTRGCLSTHLPMLGFTYVRVMGLTAGAGSLCGSFPSTSTWFRAQMRSKWRFWGIYPKLEEMLILQNVLFLHMARYCAPSLLFQAPHPCDHYQKEFMHKNFRSRVCPVDIYCSCNAD